MNDYDLKVTDKDKCPYCNSEKVKEAGVEGGTLEQDTLKFLPGLAGYNCLDCEKFYLKKLR